jgi:hypothetical protein
MATPSMIPDWLITTAFGAGGWLIGAAVTFGVFKERIQHILATQKEQGMKQKEHDNKFDVLEREGRSVMLRTECVNFRDDCHDNLKETLTGIQRAIEKNEVKIDDMAKEVSSVAKVQQRVVQKLGIR